MHLQIFFMYFFIPFDRTDFFYVFIFKTGYTQLYRKITACLIITVLKKSGGGLTCIVVKRRKVFRNRLVDLYISILIRLPKLFWITFSVIS